VVFIQDRKNKLPKLNWMVTDGWISDMTSHVFPDFPDKKPHLPQSGCGEMFGGTIFGGRPKTYRASEIEIDSKGHTKVVIFRI
jgi:hypothetical protein